MDRTGDSIQDRTEGRLKAADHRKTMLVLLVLIYLLNPSRVSGLSLQSCSPSFTTACSCSPSVSSLSEIHCTAVPLLHIPVLPIGHHYRVSITASPEIHDLPHHLFQNATVSSFTLTGSKLSDVHDNAFVGTEATLTTLDLSENRLQDFPVTALERLPLLQWLSLKGNVIGTIRPFDSTHR